MKKMNKIRLVEYKEGKEDILINWEKEKGKILKKKTKKISDDLINLLKSTSYSYHEIKKFLIKNFHLLENDK